MEAAAVSVMGRTSTESAGEAVLDIVAIDRSAGGRAEGQPKNHEHESASWLTPTISQRSTTAQQQPSQDICSFIHNSYWKPLKASQPYRPSFAAAPAPNARRLPSIYRLAYASSCSEVTRQVYSYRPATGSVHLRSNQLQPRSLRRRRSSRSVFFLLPQLRNFDHVQPSAGH